MVPIDGQARKGQRGIRGRAEGTVFIILELRFDLW